ncbi:MAG: hypothetical protein V2B19_21155 [Pseudomonadota bacterium]
MIRNVWSILCKDILTDQETNSVTYIQSIEEAAAAALPVLIAPVSIGTLWEKDSDAQETLVVRVVLVLPSGSEKPLLQSKALRLKRPRQRLQFKMAGLPVTEFGRHEVRIEMEMDEKWCIVSRLPVTIRKAGTLPKPAET